MLSFNYTIKDVIGLHARPVGLLVKEAKKFESKIIIKKGENAVEVTKLMEIMELGVKCGQTVEIEITGEDEKLAYEEMKKFFKHNL
jgi:phosphocarrier,  HPr family